MKPTWTTMVAVVGVALLTISADIQGQAPKIQIPEIPEFPQREPKGVAGLVEVVAVQLEEPKVEKLPLPSKALNTAVEENLFDAPESSRGQFGFYVGAGIYYIQPTWETNFAFSRTAQINANFVGGQTLQSFVTKDFEYRNSVAPRVFAGYENECGFGLRVSWWRFDDSAEFRFPIGFVTGGSVIVSGAGNAPGTTSTFSPVNGFTLTEGEVDALVFSNQLVMDVWDFDVSQRFGNDCWSLIVGAGIRYAFIAQTYDAISMRLGQPLSTVSGGLINSRDVHIRNSLNVAGPDLFLDGQRSLGRFGFSVYGNARAGYLVGTGQYTQRSSSTIVPPTPGFIPARHDVLDRNRAALPFLEAEIGLEWQARATNRIQPFLRVGVVSQSWFGLGSALSASGNTNTLGNLGFFGGTFMGGVSF